MSEITNEQIYNDFCEITRDAWSMPRSELDIKYEKLRCMYPKIYNMAIDSVVNGNVQESINNLKMFLKTLNDINSKNITKENADMFIGNQLGKEYIYPLTGAPTIKDYERAVKKIKQDCKKELKKN